MAYFPRAPSRSPRKRPPASTRDFALRAEEDAADAKRRCSVKWRSVKCAEAPFDFFHLLCSSTMAAAAMASVGSYEKEFNNYYQVLSDMRVVKYVFDLEQTIRLCYSIPIWRSIVIGQYVYFPSECKWIFVNACEADADDSRTKDSSIDRSIRPIPKIRYCAHRSHTPSANFADVVHREPIREQWRVLLSKLSALKHQTERNAGRRW